MSERIAAFVASLFAAAMLAAFSHQLYWARQQSHALYEFSRVSAAPLVPIACDQRRGAQGKDYIVASARTYRQKVAYVEACWYPLDRYLQLFPQGENPDVAAILRDRHDRLNLRLAAFSPKPASPVPLLGIPIAVFIGAVGLLVLLIGQRDSVEPEAPPHSQPDIDPAKLAAELSALRSRLRQ